jgi:DNA-binding beta-propeller fold protein YncE
MYDSLGDRYIISNVGTGDMVQISSRDTSWFYRGFTRTMGMVIVGNLLYNCTNAGITVFDLTTDELLDQIGVPGSVVLNDVTADTSGYLWVTDSGGDRIYRIRLSDQSSEIAVDGVYWPNGILFDETRNRILFVSFGVGVAVRAIDPVTASVSTVANTSLTNLDGITADPDGNFYISSHTGNTVHKFDPDFRFEPELVASDHDGAADIFFNGVLNELAIPNFSSHTVSFLSFDDSDGDGVPEYADNCPADYNPLQVDSDNDGMGDVCDTCCTPPTAGNVDCEGIIDIGDVTELIALLFIRVGDPFCCEDEADLDYNDDIDIGDLTVLTNRLFITVTDPPPCPQEFGAGEG